MTLDELKQQHQEALKQSLRLEGVAQYLMGLIQIEEDKLAQASPVEKPKDE